MKKGFTLAEVLITLGIIGIVAALTMPLLITKYQKKVTVTKIKKIYSELNQAMLLAKANNEEIILPDIDWLDNSRYFAENYLFKALKPVKTCIPASSECWAEIKTLAGQTSYIRDNYNTSIAAILPDGASIFLWTNSPQDSFEPHAQVWFDINGPEKGPNIAGKDAFPVIYTFDTTRFNFPGPDDRDKALNDSVYGCNSTSAGTIIGYYCGSVIRNDGWEIKEDYPW